MLRDFTFETSRCDNCGGRMPRYSRHGVCEDCRKMLTIYHRRTSAARRRGNQECYYAIVRTNPANQDLLGLELTGADFRYGEYGWLTGTIFEKDGKEYLFDGDKLVRR